MQKTLTVKLATGQLHLDVKPGEVPLKRLLGFAARVSSKRKFLLVSKVLGKHYPVTPRMMSWSYRGLARAVLKVGVSSASVWIGMAETATGLGYGVFEAAYCEGVQEALFLQTTRYHIANNERLEFEEAHSHATDFFLYYPQEPIAKKKFLEAQDLVLIDDEISTGKTFLRLIKAYQNVNPNLQNVFIVSLVNFAHSEDRLALEDQVNIPVHWISFRQGTLRFEDTHNELLDNITINVSGNGECKKHLLAWPGRLGMLTPITLPKNVVDEVRIYFDKNALTQHDTKPILVLGTGECNAPAYLLGRLLEVEGYQVKVQSTTRSPIHQGNDIELICEFKDNYDDGIPNFIYNLDPSHYQHIIICHETPLNKVLLERLKEWAAISARIEFQSPNTPHAKLYFSRS